MVNKNMIPTFSKRAKGKNKIKVRQLSAAKDEANKTEEIRKLKESINSTINNSKNLNKDMSFSSNKSSAKKLHPSELEKEKINNQCIYSVVDLLRRPSVA